MQSGHFLVDLMNSGVDPNPEFLLQVAPRGGVEVPGELSRHLCADAGHPAWSVCLSHKPARAGTKPCSCQTPDGSIPLSTTVL